MARSYLYGPDAGPITITSTSDTPPIDVPPVDPAGLVDLDPATVTLVSAAPESVTLAFPAFDPAVTLPPSEVFAVLFANGVSIPDDPAAAIEDASIPRNSTTEAVPAEGSSSYVVPHPVVPQGSYVGKTIFAYDRTE